MQYVTISKRGNDYIIQGSTDSGRTVTLDYAEYKEAIDRLAYGIDNQEDKELVEVKKQMEEVMSEKAILLEEKQELVQSIDALIDKYAEFLESKDEYQVGKAYVVGDTFSYQGVVYAVLQNHTSQADWIPSTTLSLYKVLRQTEEAGDDAVLQEWVQPTGAHDAYKIGDKVTYNGKTYESTIDGNTWSPEAYPQGWREV